MTASTAEIEGHSTIGTRIHVIGNSASGKSTLAARLAKALDSAVVELDALNWQPGWIITQHARKRKTMTACLSDPRWATFGSYGCDRPVRWKSSPRP